MVDTVLLVVDAVEGPMPQTRFVTRKALALGLNAIVVVNKIDRPGARPDWVVDQTFELFDKLGATDRQLDFRSSTVSALEGWASMDHTKRGPAMRAMYEADPASRAGAEEPDAPLQLQISTLGYNSYVGRIGIGRIRRGTVKTGQTIQLWNGAEDHGTAKILQVLTFKGCRASRSTRPWPATSWPSRASRTSTSAIRSTRSTSPTRCRRSRSMSRRSS
jgi:GTP-binding protein